MSNSDLPRDLPQEEEARLTERFLTQPPLAYRELLERYSATILRMVRRFLRDEDEVMEVYTSICERLQANDYLALRRYRSGSAIVPWLSVVAANACRDRLRKTQAGTIPRALLSKLDDWERLVYRYHFHQRVPHEDIAEMVAVQHGFRRNALEVVEAIGRIHELLGATRRHHLLSALALRRNVASLDHLIEKGIEPADGEGEDLDEGPRQKDQLARLARAFEQLEVEDRLLVQLRFEQDLTAVQIAEVMGYDTATRVYTRLRTVLKWIRQSLASDAE